MLVEKVTSVVSLCPVSSPQQRDLF